LCRGISGKGEEGERSTGESALLLVFLRNHPTDRKDVTKQFVRREKDRVAERKNAEDSADEKSGRGEGGRRKETNRCTSQRAI